jgi:hypothetical protein
VLLWRRVSAILQKEGRPGTFSQSMQLFLAERPMKVSPFVCFECDSLSEGVEEREKQEAMPNYFPRKDSPSGGEARA